MGSIAGFFTRDENLLNEQLKWDMILSKMEAKIFYRKDGGISHVDENIALTGDIFSNGDYIISFCGDIYNREELPDRCSKGDVRAVLDIIITYGLSGLDKINGVFSGVLFHKSEKKLFLFRDHLGISPLFYTVKDNIVIFASESKALFAYPDITPVLDRTGLCQIFGLAPARKEDSGVYKGIYSVRPG